MTWSGLPKRAHSALSCLCCLAEAGTSLQAHRIAERTGTARAETAKVLQVLRSGGFVDSRRGTKGGFRLHSAPDQIVAGEVISLFLPHRAPETNDDDPVSRAIHETGARVRAEFEHLTLSDIIAGRLRGSTTQMKMKIGMTT